MIHSEKGNDISQESYIISCYENYQNTFSKFYSEHLQLYKNTQKSKKYGGGPVEASTSCTANDFKISLTKGREEAM